MPPLLMLLVRFDTQNRDEGSLIWVISPLFPSRVFFTQFLLLLSISSPFPQNLTIISTPPSPFGSFSHKITITHALPPTFELIPYKLAIIPLPFGSFPHKFTTITSSHTPFGVISSEIPN